MPTETTTVSSENNSDVEQRTSDASIEEQIKQAEQDYWQAMKDKDVEGCLTLSDFPTIIAGAQGGVSIDEAMMRKMFDTADYTVEEFTLSDFVVRVVNEDCAIASYKASMRMTVDDAPIELDTAQMSTWLRRDGAWACAGHAEAILGDPFGRDRRAH
jgi:ketosteroid isomerase-like protein